MLVFAPYYFFVYWVIVMLMTFRQFNSMRNWPNNSGLQMSYGYQPIFLFSIFFILFFGLRPISGMYFGDTKNYANTFELLQQFGILNADGTDDAKKDFLFYTLMKACAQVMDVHSFFLICMALYIVPMFAGCKKIDPSHGALLILFCVGAFEFYAFAVNGIRNGIACSLLILAVAFLTKGDKLWPVVLSLVAIGFHKSAALPFATMFFVYYVRKPTLMYLVWFGAIAVSLTVGDYIDNMLSLMSYDERLASDLQSDDADGVILEHRFRWDFLLYSSMPILLGWYTIFKRKLQNSTYLILLGTYIYANSFWVLAIRALFSNRIAYLSWFIYPIVLAYPLLNFPVFKKNHSQKTAWILLGHFGFTTILWLLGK